MMSSKRNGELQLCAAVKNPMEIWENLIDLMLRALLVMIVVEQHRNKIENGLKRGEDTGRVE